MDDCEYDFAGRMSSSPLRDVAAAYHPAGGFLRGKPGARASSENGRRRGALDDRGNIGPRRSLGTPHHRPAAMSAWRDLDRCCPRLDGRGGPRRGQHMEGHGPGEGGGFPAAPAAVLV